MKLSSQITNQIKFINQRFGQIAGEKEEICISDVMKIRDCGDHETLMK